MSHFQPSKYHSPELIIDGCNFYPAIFRELESAQESILIENYLVEDGELWDQLCRTLIKRADNNVLIQCIFDAFGTLGVHDDISKLSRHPNITIKLFNPIRLHLGSENLRRTHVKLFIIDNRVAFTGGAGITDSFYKPSTKSSAWSEVMVKVQDQDIGNISDIFQWKFDAIGSKSKALATPFKGPVYIFEKRLEGWLYAHHFSTHWIKRALYKKLASAQSRIWINSAYFFPTRRTLRFLKRKAKEGIDVRILLPGVTDVLLMKYLARGRYKRLLQAGVSIHELNDRFLHSKVIIVDDWTTLGSFNLDVFSFRFNHELNYASKDHDFLKDAEGFFLSKLQSAVEIKPEEWTNRVLMSKVLERGAYKLAQLFMKVIK
ncbi:phosphatidylserine/phosphatidylglycerophosphate/cardiolipin synthase family protein [Litoribrevibacter euphylliae]|uniref:Phosphatidylserine/phosphatidylglycerophosphate/ cardiolipin synthase family protein n=1 Tax=Litoribrevibacter euphylliae TaxID=1834034 RepID=A0ABV7HGU6_9GAMM